jgi:serine/threonine protein kinase
LLPLVPPSHTNLAGPPSLDSCTRDVYPPGLRIPAPTVLRVARGIADAVAHLHQRGVLHGDLYAHNILWNPDTGDALLSDFGAATLLPLGRADVCHALQALEVRAFGCLLEELLAHTEPVAGQAVALEGIAALASACLHATPAARPTMAEVALSIKSCMDFGGAGKMPG